MFNYTDNIKPVDSAETLPEKRKYQEIKRPTRNNNKLVGTSGLCSVRIYPLWLKLSYFTLLSLHLRKKQTAESLDTGNKIYQSIYAALFYSLSDLKSHNFKCLRGREMCTRLQYNYFCHLNTMTLWMKCALGLTSINKDTKGKKNHRKDLLEGQNCIFYQSKVLCWKKFWKFCTQTGRKWLSNQTWL